MIAAPFRVGFDVRDCVETYFTLKARWNQSGEFCICGVVFLVGIARLLKTDYAADEWAMLARTNEVHPINQPIVDKLITAANAKVFAREQSPSTFDPEQAIVLVRNRAQVVEDVDSLGRKVVEVVANQRSKLGYVPLRSNDIAGCRTKVY
jgi:hypothetical protein